jgi:BMFP domain-containing protein YqiC
MYNKNMQAILPIEVYEALEKNIGHDDAKLVLKSFETAITANIEYTWVMTKDDLLSEMKQEFATKSDLMLVRGEIQLIRTVLSGEINKVDAKIDKVHTELNGKIDKVHTELNSKIDKVHTELNGKIDKVHTELNGKIDMVKTELRAEIKSEIQTVRYEMRLYLLIIIFVIILNNPKAIDLIAKLFGIAK